MKRLVKKAMAGNKDAFAQLMEMNTQSMYKVARAYFTSDADVADAISETVLICFEQLDTLRKPEYFKTWMTRILVNKCYDLIRSNKTVAWEDYIPDPAYREQEYENIEWKQTLDSLSEKYRLIMMLYYVEGFKVSEISQILDLSEGTVKSRLSRGRDRLTEAFELRQRRAN